MTQGTATVSSLDKMLALLDLFTEAQPVWSIEQARTRTGYARSTLYRYCRSLVRAGLLDPVGRGGFMLGARIMDLDRALRTGSPLIAAARTPMATLARQSRLSVMLCRTHGDRLVCVHDELGGDDASEETRRGRSAPLAHGTIGRVVLGYLPPSRLRQMHAAGVGEAGRPEQREGWETYWTLGVSTKEEQGLSPLPYLEPPTRPVRHGQFDWSF